MLARMATASPISEKTEAKTQEPSPEDLGRILARMKRAQLEAGTPSYEKRVERLDKLLKGLLAHKEEFVKAISEDFGNRSPHETYGAEIMVTVNSCKHGRAHLHEWMEVEPRPVSWLFAPARAEIVPQPLGVV